jgi:hypothetical protein
MMAVVRAMSEMMTTNGIGQTPDKKKLGLSFQWTFVGAPGGKRDCGKTTEYHQANVLVL